MKKLNDFKKRKAEQEQEIDKLSGNLDALRQSRVDLEAQIIAAIDTDNLSVVDKLTEKETEMDNKIRAGEKILERKKETAQLDPDEVAAANNAEMKKYQGDISDTMKEAEKHLRLYYETIIQAAEIAQNARQLRLEYLLLVGAEHDDYRFDTVHGGLKRGPFSNHEMDLMNGIKPNAVNLVNYNLRN